MSKKHEKQLIIVGTKPSIGKGGISTALVGYLQGLQQQEVPYTFIESHSGDTNTLLSWLLAWIKVIKLSVKYRSNAVFWFHGAQWLSSFRKFTLALFPRLLGADTLFHIHSPAFNNYLTNHWFSKWLTKLALLPFSHIVVLTPWWQKLLVQQGINKKMIVAPNPNNAEYCQIASQKSELSLISNDGKTRVNILTMARMVEGKGVELVIQALADLPKHFHLTVAGDGDKLADFKAMAQQLELGNRITFTGWISGEQKSALLNQSDLFCLPSTYDSFGMVFIEAMAFNLPVVAYGWGPIPNVVTQDVGECCQQPTTDEVVRGITHVASRLDDYHGKGPQRVLRYYTPSVVVGQIIQQLNVNN